MATVFIDNIQMGTTPYYGQINTGSHTVSLYLPGYYPYDTQVSVYATTPAYVSATLYEMEGAAGGDSGGGGP
jgi:hypothetical protein